MCLFVFVLSFFVGAVKANESNLLKEFGGHLELTGDCTRLLLNKCSRLREKEQLQR